MRHLEGLVEQSTARNQRIQDRLMLRLFEANLCAVSAICFIQWGIEAKIKSDQATAVERIRSGRTVEHPSLRTTYKA